MRYNFIIYTHDKKLYVFDERENVLFDMKERRHIEAIQDNPRDIHIHLSQQEEDVLRQIVYTGSISSYTAFVDLNIVALTTRISQMRAKGLPILSKTVRYTASDGTYKHYNKYYLWEDNDEQQEITL